MTTQTQQFQRELSLSSRSKEYLEERGFLENLVNLFGIGFCPAESNYNFDLLNGRLIVPIYDAYGDQVAYAGRKMDAYSSDVKNFYQSKTTKLDGYQKFFKWKTSKWINTPYKKSDHLYNLNNAKKAIFEKNFCFVVEGYFDVMTLCKNELYNVVALCGTSLTDRQCELIFRYCNNVVFMLDGDDSGRIATIKSVARARAKGLYAHVVELPNGCDPDQLTTDQLSFISNQVLNSEEELCITL